MGDVEEYEEGMDDGKDDLQQQDLLDFDDD